MKNNLRFFLCLAPAALACNTTARTQPTVAKLETCVLDPLGKFFSGWIAQR